MKLKEKIKGLFSEKKEERLELSDTLAKLGIHVYTDKKLERRIEALERLFDVIEREIETEDPEEYLTILKDKLNFVNRAIQVIAAPYYRAANNPAFRLLMEGWHLWYALAINWVYAVEDRIKQLQRIEMEAETETERQLALINIKTLIRRLHGVLHMHVFKDAFLVLSVSYQKRDVTPSYAITVKTLPTTTRQPTTLQEPRELEEALSYPYEES